MLSGRVKCKLLILILLLTICGYLGYQVYEDRVAQDEKVAYFLKNTEIVQRRQLKDLPATAIPFYGDSLVQGFAANRVSPSLQNFGIGHDHSGNLLGRIRVDLRYRQFSQYAIAIGINDLGRGLEVGDIYHNILTIVELLTFADTIYLHTVLPVAAGRANAIAINREVSHLNELLSDLPIGHRSVVIVDTYGELAVDDSLPGSFHIGDGLHLNSAANRKWAELLSAAMSARKLKGLSDGSTKN